MSRVLYARADSYAMENASTRAPAAMARILEIRSERQLLAMEVDTFGTATPSGVLASVAAVLRRAGVPGRIDDVALYKSSVAIVAGLHLDDDQVVVVKSFRSVHDGRFLAAGRDVHAWLAGQGAPVPRPLSGVLSTERGHAVVDEWLDAPEAVAITDTTRHALACAFGEHVVNLAPVQRHPDLRRSYQRVPPASLWPPPVRPSMGLRPLGSDSRWLVELAETARDTMRATDADEMLGHIDWRPANVRLDDAGRVVALYDMDSVQLAPEPILVGRAAAGACSCAAEVQTWIDAYEASSGRRLSLADRATALAAAKWQVAVWAMYEQRRDIPHAERSAWPALLSWDRVS